MDDEELQAIRAQRMAQIQNQYAVRGPAIYRI